MENSSENIESMKVGNEEAHDVNGGRSFDNPVTDHANYVDLEKVKGHQGTKINKYETEAHIGEMAIIKVPVLIGSDAYYVGTIERSWEDKVVFGWFGTSRTVTLKCANGEIEQFDNPKEIWLYK